ncbi:M15 family metallopeptidase [Vibrio hannami]|nr:M15 family metallopeptidase [Vibrio hannami]MDG3088108.1 M15 family metallopeptidase [Vibrio hannami]
MSWVLSPRSESRMVGVKDELKQVVRLALKYSPYDFGITSGMRTAAQQYQLFVSGKSNCDGTNIISRHQTGHAIDFVVYDENGQVTWDMAYYKAVSDAFKRAAKELDIQITWGGDWATLQDGPHVELKQGVYA